MTTSLIITICVLLLIAYIFDLTSSKTRIPSVLLLLLMGWGVKQITVLVDIQLPDLSPALQILGTIGLILIVLEGALELEFDASKIPVLKKTFIVALLPMVILAFILAYAFHYFGGYSFKDSMTNAIPLCVISSAIAIPSAANLNRTDREYIIYESSLSDILGVMFFNFLALNEVINAESIGHFFLQLLIILIISFIATLGLSFLLSRIEHHVKFIPIIILIILIYAISKIYHLPALLFILVFGLFLGNLDELKRIKWIERLRPEVLDGETKKFKEITIEATFLTRVLFFLVFGYLIETLELFNPETAVWSASIVGLIFLIRALALKLTGSDLQPLLFFAPRGLITILLFLSVLPEQVIPLVNQSLIIQVIVLTALVMMAGLMVKGKKTLPVAHSNEQATGSAQQDLQ